ncbi:MAG TPA: hypothetical protein VGP68_19435, partial [Gemmataceae bacterium]|nr:hypothetical protein [Gemmataceae bacterium]
MKRTLEPHIFIQASLAAVRFSHAQTPNHDSHANATTDSAKLGFFALSRQCADFLRRDWEGKGDCLVDASRFGFTRSARIASRSARCCQPAGIGSSTAAFRAESNRTGRNEEGAIFLL